MDTARILARLPIIMGVPIGVLILFIIVSGLATSLIPALSTHSSRSDYSLPALKSMCMEFASSTWRLLLRPAESWLRSSAESLSSETSSRLITSGSIFLLINLIILALLVTTHIERHAPAAAVNKRSSSRKNRHLQQSNRLQLLHQSQAAPAEKSMESPSLVGFGEAGSSAYADLHDLSGASMESWKEGLRAPYQTKYGEEIITAFAPATKMEEGPYEASIALYSSITDVSPMQENLSTEGQESSTVDSRSSNSPGVQRIMLEADGRLRLVDGEGIDAAKTGHGGGLILPSEDTDGSDAEKIVLQDDGRLRFIDRPLPVSGFMNKPLKSLSDTAYCPKDADQDSNYQIDCLNDGRKTNHSIHSEPIHGFPNVDQISNPATNYDAVTDSGVSSPISKRPTRVKKADSLDTTWKAINENKGNTVNSTPRYKDNKHLIRQRSRTGFKPNTRGSVRDSHGNKSSAVRREPSIGQEELNAKVESFIARFNEQIRIQRQESILSFIQMVDRGA